VRTSPPERARVVIAAAPTLFRAGLRRIIEGEWPSYTVIEANTLSTTTDYVGTYRPDLLVLDLELTDSPKSVVLRRFASNVPVIVLADSHHVEFEALLRPEITFVDKQSDTAAFLQAIRSTLMNGKAPVHVPARRPRRLPATAGRMPRHDFNLTARERQIVAEVAAAYPNKEIARRLNISEQTVKRHVNMVFTKLGVSNRVELTLFATHWGLLHDSNVVQLVSRAGESSLAG